MKWILATIFILFAGCSAVPFDDGVIRDENGNSIIDGTSGALITQSFLFEVVKGNIEGHSSVHKFGSGELTTTMAPITRSGFYRVPTTPTTLEFVSDNIADNFTGSGARQITIIGLNSSWEEEEVTINTNGLTPVTIPTDYLRVYRWYVSSSGTYADQNTGSHIGNLEIREQGAGQTWSQIPNTPFATGQSEISVYTIPAGKTGYFLNKNVFTDTSKTADIFFYQRCNANDTTAPYSGNMRLLEREVGLQGGISLNFESPKGPFVGPCDIGFMGKVSTGTADASVEFELLLIDN